MDALTALTTRRSVKPKELAPGCPTDAELETMLRIATRVPDHGKLCPWRIVVIAGEGQRRLGDIAAAQYEKIYGPLNDAQRANEQARFARAPLVLAVLSTPKESVKAPRWEQELSAGAVCMNILHAAHALGYGACWLTEWVAFDPVVTAALLTPPPAKGEEGRGPAVAAGGMQSPHGPTPTLPFAGEGEKIAGFIYIGGKVETLPEDRERPKLEDVVTHYSYN